VFENSGVELSINCFLFFQGYFERAHGPAQPGPISALQHPTPTTVGPEHPAPPDPLLSHHPRLWVSGHCRGPHRHPQLSQRESQGPREGIPSTWFTARWSRDPQWAPHATPPTGGSGCCWPAGHEADPLGLQAGHPDTPSDASV